MELKYARDNYGDELNPYIFNHYLNNPFGKEKNSIFLGIGSILGMFKGGSIQTKVVFSSGYAAGQERTYGKKPKIDDSYKIFCVRGPLTSEILNIDVSLAVLDGAYLLRGMIDELPVKKYKVSFMPHYGSVHLYDWQYICSELGLNFINPKDDVETVLNAILDSERLITEALHGAITADAFRIPWAAVKLHSQINAFKWQDWSKSLEMEYNPVILPRLFSKQEAYKILQKKLGVQAFTNIATYAFVSKQNMLSKGMFIRNLNTIIKNDAYFLSNERVMSNKVDILFEKLQDLKGYLAKNS